MSAVRTTAHDGGPRGRAPAEFPVGKRFRHAVEFSRSDASLRPHRPQSRGGQGPSAGLTVRVTMEHAPRGGTRETRAPGPRALDNRPNTEPVRPRRPVRSLGYMVTTRSRVR